MRLPTVRTPHDSAASIAQYTVQRWSEATLQLFDPQFYCAQVPGLDVADAWAHYVLHGDAAGQQPSPYFDPDHFRRHTRDNTRRAREEPTLMTYARAANRGRDLPAHPLFDAVFYHSSYPDTSQMPALIHFARHGDAECRQPSDAFDTAFYRRTYLAHDATKPFHHYVTHGQQAGYVTRPRRTLTAESKRAMQAASKPDALVIVSHDARHGGGPQAALLLAREAQRRGEHVVIVLLRGGEHVEQFTRVAPTFVLPEGWDASGLWQGLAPGTRVIANTAVSATAALEIRQLGHRALLLIHEFPTSIKELGVDDPCRAAVAADITLGFAFSSTQLAFHDELAPVPTGQSVIVGPPPLGADADADTASRETARATLDAARHTGPLVAGAGVADHRKGFDIFLTTALAMQATYPAASFVWFGDVDPWAHALAASAREEGLALTLAGHVEPFDAWIGACDALLVTSRSDVGPATVLHAAREGVPVVAFDTELGAREYVMRIGALIPQGDIPGAVAALGSLTSAPSAAAAQERRAEAAVFEAAAYTSRVLDALA